jgi:hypothetical protein
MKLKTRKQEKAEEQHNITGENIKNKKFCEDLHKHFPLLQHERIEDVGSNNSIVARAFIVANISTEPLPSNDKGFIFYFFILFSWLRTSAGKLPPSRHMHTSHLLITSYTVK